MEATTGFLVEATTGHSFHRDTFLRETEGDKMWFPLGAEKVTQTLIKLKSKRK